VRCSFYTLKVIIFFILTLDMNSDFHKRVLFQCIPHRAIMRCIVSCYNHFIVCATLQSDTASYSVDISWGSHIGKD